MTAPVFSVAPEIFERFPTYVVGWVEAQIDPQALPADEMARLLADAEERARLLYANRDLKDELAIAVWRSAFSTLGWSASKYPASVEAIVKRVARGGSLPAINPLVDLANTAVLTYLTPVGCHDLERSPGLMVRLATEDDEFLPMGDTPAEHPAAGEPVYVSGHTVRTRRWVWRQSRDALIDAMTSRILFPVDGFSDTTMSRVDAAANFIETTLRQWPGSTVSRGLIDRDHPSLSP